MRVFCFLFAAILTFCLPFSIYAAEDECAAPQDLQMNAICSFPELKAKYSSLSDEKREKLKLNCRTIACLNDTLDEALTGKKKKKPTFIEFMNEINGKKINFDYDGKDTSERRNFDVFLDRQTANLLISFERIPSDIIKELTVSLSIIPPKMNGKTKLHYNEHYPAVTFSSGERCREILTVIDAAVCQNEELKQLYLRIEEKQEREKPNGVCLMNHKYFMPLLLQAKTLKQLKSALEIRLNLKEEYTPPLKEEYTPPKTYTYHEPEKEKWLSDEEIKEMLEKVETLPSGLLQIPEDRIYDRTYQKRVELRNRLFFTDYYRSEKFRQTTDALLKRKEECSTTDCHTHFQELLDKEQKRFDDGIEYLNEKVNGYLDSVKTSHIMGFDPLFGVNNAIRRYEPIDIASLPQGAKLSEVCDDIIKERSFFNPKNSLSFASLPYAFSMKANKDQWGTEFEIYRFPIEKDHKKTQMKTMPFRNEEGSAGFFMHDEVPYIAASNSKKTDIINSQFDEKAGFFKEICRFSGNITGIVSTQDAAICQTIAGNKHQILSPVPVTDLIPADEWNAFHQAKCSEAKKEHDEKQKNVPAFSLSECMLDSFSAPWLEEETVFLSEGLEVDHDNDGKKEILLHAAHADFSETGCNTTLFMIYDRKANTARRITDTLPSCIEGKQEIVAIGGKNYLLSTKDGAPERLDEITVQPDGTTKAQRLCTFEPHYEYK